jgi:hypothetical protein
MLQARLRQKGRWPVLTDPVGQVTKSHYSASFHPAIELWVLNNREKLVNHQPLRGWGIKNKEDKIS